MKHNKIITHNCGGAGIRVSDEVLKSIAELGDGFADIVFNYLDTTDANIKNIEHDEKRLWLVKSKDFNGNAVSGSGAERATNAPVIMESVKDYLDNRGYKTLVGGEYHLVISSAAGGSGAVISAMVIKSLLERNIPTIALLIGDSSNELSAKNTVKSLATLNNIAKQTKKPVSTIYINNTDYTVNNGGLRDAENSANKTIFNSISTLAVFLSGCNDALDDQDMLSIIDQSIYKSIDIKPGLYGLSTFSKDIVLQDNTKPTVARTLTLPNKSADINVSLRHSKAGNLVVENVIEIFGDQIPIHLVTYSNIVSAEVGSLNKAIEAFEESMRLIEIDDLEVDGDVDDSGLVF